MTLLASIGERAACMALCATVLTASAQATSPAGGTSTPQMRPAYFNGRVVDMKYSPGKHDFKIGPWNILAHVLHEKPRDPHPNLYIVAPGKQYEADGAEQYDHNEIVSVLPLKSEPVEWDVYYAVVLDPSLQEDFRSERELILATQNEFAAGENFTFDQIPGAAFLRKYLHIDSVEGLKPYSRPDGKLPRLIIVPAKISVKATAIDPESVSTATVNKSSVDSVPPPR